MLDFGRWNVMESDLHLVKTFTHKDLTLELLELFRTIDLKLKQSTYAFLTCSLLYYLLKLEYS